MVWEERRLLRGNSAGQPVLGGGGWGELRGGRQNKERKQESGGIVCILLPPEGGWPTAKTDKTQSSSSSWFNLY